MDPAATSAAPRPRAAVHPPQRFRGLAAKSEGDACEKVIENPLDHLVPAPRRTRRARRPAKPPSRVPNDAVSERHQVVADRRLGIEAPEGLLGRREPQGVEFSLLGAEIRLPAGGAIAPVPVDRGAESTPREEAQEKPAGQGPEAKRGAPKIRISLAGGAGGERRRRFERRKGQSGAGAPRV